jgi:hypothetical protein
VSVNLGYQYFGCRKHSSIMWWWSLKNDKLHLANIKVQVQKWITHNIEFNWSRVICCQSQLYYLWTHIY